MSPAEWNLPREKRITTKCGASSKRFDASMSPYWVNHEHEGTLWKLRRPVRTGNPDVSARRTGSGIPGGTGGSGVSVAAGLSVSILLGTAHTALSRRAVDTGVGWRKDLSQA